MDRAIGIFKEVLLVGGLVAGLASGAQASTAFHVGATSDGGLGLDPNPIPSNSQFFIADNPNKAINSPLSIYFAIPDGESAPTLSSILYNGLLLPSINYGAITQLPGTFTSGDLYTFVGCTSCNNSVNFANISLAEKALFGGVAPTAYDVYQVLVQVGFAGKDFI